MFGGKELRALREENVALKVENAMFKERLSQLMAENEKLDKRFKNEIDYLREEKTRLLDKAFTDRAAAAQPAWDVPEEDSKDDEPPVEGAIPANDLFAAYRELYGPLPPPVVPAKEKQDGEGREAGS